MSEPKKPSAPKPREPFLERLRRYRDWLHKLWNQLVLLFERLQRFCRHWAPSRVHARFVEKHPVAYEKLVGFLTSLPWPQTRRERHIYTAIGIGLLMTLAAPFVFRPAGKPLFYGRPDFELVILTPHNETIRREFSDAFAAWFKTRTGKRVHVDWRTPGGTSEIVKVIQSEYHAAFENYWRKSQRPRWEDSYGRAFNDAKFNFDPAAKEAPTHEQEARALFLKSDVGIGVDLFFGGGVYDFEKQQTAGTLVSADSSGKFGLAALRREHPDWFSDAVIPQQVGGEPYYDPTMVWAGTCLSSFGIVHNKDTVERLGARHPPERWEDLTDPIYYGRIAVVDPTKSGSIVKAFEMIIQQQIRISLDKARRDIELALPRLREGRETAALQEGWANGLRIIQRIGANARYFTDSATKVPSDVAQGIAAAGVCIDFYGRTVSERVKEADGSSRVQFGPPPGGTSTGVDSVAMFRGAPHPAVAHAFLEFLFSTDGQALWDFRPGTPGGPRRESLRRLPVRKDMYVPEKLAYFADPDVMPYQHASDFAYEPKWTADSLDAIRVAVRVMCIDTQDELRQAWRALAAHGFPRTATDGFGEMGPLVSKDYRRRIGAIMRSGDKLGQVRLLRQLGYRFRNQYELAVRNARRGT